MSLLDQTPSKLARIKALIAAAEADLAALERRWPKDPPELTHSLKLWLAALHTTHKRLLQQLSLEQTCSSSQR